MAERGQRRSARISALEASKVHQVAGDTGGEKKYIDKAKQIVVIRQGLELPGRKKRKTRRVEEVVVNSVVIEVGQELAIAEQEEQPCDPVQRSSSPSTSLKLDKRAYEIIIDILEKRDKMNVFAQPVDPKEVKDYYEFIKEPMDFGTIKTKIQDGKYTTLKEFERDVALVSGNAMQFNGPSTSYSKLGCAIYQLATKLFNAVKADPENYEAVLSNLRPRPGRRPVSHSTNEIPNCMKDNVAPNATGRRSVFYEEESRRTSRPWNEFRSHNESIASTVYESPKQLINGNSSIGYTESLMRYVKNMGPKVEKIARRKLIEFPVHGPNSQIGSTSTQQRPNPPNSVYTIPTSQNFINNFSGPRTVSNPPRSVINIPPSQTILNNFSALPTIPNPSNRVVNVPTSQNLVRNFSGLPAFLAKTGGQLDSRSAFRGETSHQNHSSEIQMDSGFPISSAGHLNFHVNGLTNSGTGYFSPIDLENREITRPGPSYRVSPVPRWNRPSPVLQSSGIEQNRARTESVPTYGGSTALLAQVMGWNQSSVVSSSFGGQNLPMTAPGAVNSVEAKPILAWKQASVRSPSFGAGNREMGSPGLAYGTQPIHASSVPDCNQPNASLILGEEIQGMDASGVKYGINMTQGGSAPVPFPVPTPVLEWNQQRVIPRQDAIDMSCFQTRLTEMTSFDQKGGFQPEEPQLAPVPETVLVGQMGFCGRGPTNAAYQTGLSNLTLMDSLQQPDLALQL